MTAPAPTSWSRREFLQASVASLGATWATGATKRPNILFLWTDQHVRSAASFMGNPHLRTPAIDRVAEAGVVFERAYCSDPICVPSRTSWLTGLYSHQTGVAFNTDRQSITGAPLSRLLRDAGYDTGYVGKWHIPHPAADTEWHGFSYVRHARTNQLDRDVVPACQEFLRRPRRQPFFLVASFVNPHDICEWARTAAGWPESLPNGDLPAGVPADQWPPAPANLAPPNDEPEVIRQLQAAAPRTYPGADWPPEKWREYRWAYYRLVETVDAQLGAILETLRATGADADTLIIFASDHGDGMGAHGWNQKTLFYEEIVGVPLVIRPPGGGGGGRRIRELASFNLDFFPTVFDYAGLRLPEKLPGRSLRGLVAGQPHASGHAFLVAQNDLAPRYGRSGGVVGRMLLTHRYKYVRYSHGGDAEQLFDLRQDPGELRDLKYDPAHRPTLRRLRDQLTTWLRDHGDPFPAPA